MAPTAAIMITVRYSALREAMRGDDMPWARGGPDLDVPRPRHLDRLHALRTISVEARRGGQVRACVDAVLNADTDGATLRSRQLHCALNLDHDGRQALLDLAGVRSGVWELSPSSWLHRGFVTITGRTVTHPQYQADRRPAVATGAAALGHALFRKTAEPVSPSQLRCAQRQIHCCMW